MRSTIQDVAKMAGVSVATVSRIVNGLDGFSEETRVRVNRAVEALSYRPNAVARGLVSRRTKTIGVLLPQVTEKFATLLLEGIEARAHQKGYSVIVCNTESNGRRTMEYLRVLSEKQVDGILFTSEWLTDAYGAELSALKIPVILVSTQSTKFPFPYVKVDDRLAAYHATKYLIDRGHRNIGMISGTPSDPIAGSPRLEGWKQAMRDHNLPAAEEQIAYGDFHFHSGIEAAHGLIEAFPSVSAIFCASDEMAMGVLSYAYRAGIRVPDDLSVIGYDDTSIAEMGIPPLSSVHQPVFEMGERSVDMLIAPKESTSVLMPFSITERESVRRLSTPARR